MNQLRKILAITSLLIWSIFANAADTANTPNATVVVNIKFIVLNYGQQTESSGSVLTYQGKQYPFKVSGLTLGPNVIGATVLSAKGQVYGLSDLSKFAGTYFKTGGSIMPVTGGQSTLQNENGVILHLEGTVNGPLDPSPDGAVVTFSK